MEGAWWQSASAEGVSGDKRWEGEWTQNPSTNPTTWGQEEASPVQVVESQTQANDWGAISLDSTQQIAVEAGQLADASHMLQIAAQSQQLTLQKGSVEAELESWWGSAFQGASLGTMPWGDENWEDKAAEERGRQMARNYANQKNDDGWSRMDNSRPKVDATVDPHLYYVDNRSLRSTTQGLGYRLSKLMDHKDGNELAPWGTVVVGTFDGDGWVRVGHRFLPIEFNGHVVLIPKGPVPAFGADAPLAESPTALLQEYVEFAHAAGAILTAQEEGKRTKQFLVDNSGVATPAPGLAYRKSKRLWDRDPEMAYWGSMVTGVEEGDGWVRVGEWYLPKMWDAAQVLVAWDTQNGCPAPEEPLQVIPDSIVPEEQQQQPTSTEEVPQQLAHEIIYLDEVDLGFRKDLWLQLDEGTEKCKELFISGLPLVCSEDDIRQHLYESQLGEVMGVFLLMRGEVSKGMAYMSFGTHVAALRAKQFLNGQVSSCISCADQFGIPDVGAQEGFLSVRFSEADRWSQGTRGPYCMDIAEMFVTNQDGATFQELINGAGIYHARLTCSALVPRGRWKNPKHRPRWMQTFDGRNPAYGEDHRAHLVVTYDSSEGPDVSEMKMARTVNIFGSMVEKIHAKASEVSFERTKEGNLGAMDDEDLSLGNNRVIVMLVDRTTDQRRAPGCLGGKFDEASEHCGRPVWARLADAENPEDMYLYWAVEEEGRRGCWVFSPSMEAERAVAWNLADRPHPPSYGWRFSRAAPRDQAEIFFGADVKIKGNFGEPERVDEWGEGGSYEEFGQRRDHGSKGYGKYGSYGKGSCGKGGKGYFGKMGKDFGKDFGGARRESSNLRTRDWLPVTTETIDADAFDEFEEKEENAADNNFEEACADFEEEEGVIDNNGQTEPMSYRSRDNRRRSDNGRSLRGGLDQDRGRLGRSGQSGSSNSIPIGMSRSTRSDSRGRPRGGSSGRYRDSGRAIGTKVYRDAGEPTRPTKAARLNQ